MLKYLRIYKTSIKQERDTIIDTLLRAVSFFIIIYIFVQLWSFIYGKSGTSSVINGYSLEQMIWYLIITELIVTCARNRLIITSIGNEIKSGGIAYKLNRPYNFYLYNITTFMGKSTWMLMFMFPIGLVMGLCFVGIVPTFTWYQILPNILSLILSFLLVWAMFAIVGLLSFWIEDASPFSWILQKFLMLFGLFFPVEFFPAWLQPVIEYSPIYSVFSGPAKLVANFSWDLFLKVFISQSVWCVILILIGIGVYNLGKRRVNVNGG